MKGTNQTPSPAAASRSVLGPRSALALCGFTAVVGQIVLMRELIQVFNGNEISLGILLGELTAMEADAEKAEPGWAAAAGQD